MPQGNGGPRIEQSNDVLAVVAGDRDKRIGDTESRIAYNRSWRVSGLWTALTRLYVKTRFLGGSRHGLCEDRIADNGRYDSHESKNTLVSLIRR